MESICVAILGSTGAVGRKVVQYLVEYHNHASKKSESELPLLKTIYAYTRRNTTIESFIAPDELKAKPYLANSFYRLVKVVVIDFDNPPEEFGREVHVLHVCLGTTLAKSGKDGQYKIDHDYAVNLSSLARKNGVAVCSIVSSVGANPRSWSHYTKMKGQIEEDMKRLKFQSLIIARPGLIRTTRDESRPLESALRALAILDTFSYASIRSEDIACAMIYVTLKEVVSTYKLLLESMPTAEEVPHSQADKQENTCTYLSSRDMTLTSQRFRKSLQ